MNVVKLAVGTAVLVSISLSPFLGVSYAEVEIGFYNPYVTAGPRISPNTVVPTLRKWYLPQSLYSLYEWRGWEYSNYARDLYRRYVDIQLEGNRYYDLYGNYITKGWRIYSWSEQYPKDFGSSVFKHPNFSGWFDRLLISYASKGEFYTALTVGEAVRTTLTPLTFSKPLYDGVQWDFASDKYAATLLASRVSNTALVARTEGAPATSFSTSTDLLGFRGTVQLGDFAQAGLTYVNISHRNTGLSLDKNSLKGVLSGALNAGNIRRLAVRLSDDSPEDGEGGALLFRDRIFVEGVEHPEIRPLIEGGIRRQGVLEASGGNTITLTYDIEHDFMPSPDDKAKDFREIRKVDIGLVLANDYKVEVTSNMQTNALGEPVFLLVTRALGNVKDGANQKYIRFQYGLPSGNELAGVTLAITDLAGFNLRGEYVANRRFRRFPNQSIVVDQALATDVSHAFYVTASQMSYPWFAYAEVFSMDPDYSTSMFIPDAKSFIDYEKKEYYLYELVDDNDDQDRYPDWRRRYFGPYEAQDDREIFPGLDENNDLISDFNQNNNDQPDYEEPFLRYDVDPPEFLFGMDMNHNTVIDRFENDTEPDYPYKRDHRGYNVYTGVEISPGSRFMVGYLNEWLIASRRKNRDRYALLTVQRDFPGQALGIQCMVSIENVHDDIPDNLIQWVQPPFSSGLLEDFPDPLIAQHTFINTMYLEVNYSKLLPFKNKLKYQIYHQKGFQRRNKRDRKLLGIVNKADYRIPIRKSLSLWPKWKQMYKYVVPTDPQDHKTKELSEILFFLVRYQITKGMWVHAGSEYEFFNNLEKVPTPVPAGFNEDFKRLTLAIQFSNSVDYLGYKTTANVGFRWNRRSFKEKTETSSIAFMDFYVGAQK